MRNAAVDYSRSHKYAAAELDAIAQALDRLLTRHQAVLKAEGMDRQVQNLKRWMEENRKSFLATGFFPETGSAWLADLCDHLKLAVEERQRLENEGGLPAPREQDEQNDELLNTIFRIEKIVHIGSEHS